MTLEPRLLLNRGPHEGLVRHAPCPLYPCFPESTPASGTPGSGRPLGRAAVEIFAARQHFDYTSREHVAELSAWFRSNPLEPFSMHAPLFPIAKWAVPAHPPSTCFILRKSRRIDAMDEIKRALEAAEHIPFRNLIVHLGERTDLWSPRTIEPRANGT